MRTIGLTAPALRARSSPQAPGARPTTASSDHRPLFTCSPCHPLLFRCPPYPIPRAAVIVIHAVFLAVAAASSPLCPTPFPAHPLIDEMRPPQAGKECLTHGVGAAAVLARRRVGRGEDGDDGVAAGTTAAAAAAATAPDLLGGTVFEMPASAQLELAPALALARTAAAAVVDGPQQAYVVAAARRAVATEVVAAVAITASVLPLPVRAQWLMATIVLCDVAARLDAIGTILAVSHGAPA